MGQFDGDKEFPATSAINLLLNLHQIQSLHQDVQQTQMWSSSDFDPAVSQDDFIEQMLSSVPAAFPWADEQQAAAAGSLEEPAPPQANSLMMLQHQFCDEWIDGSDAVEAASFAPANLANDAAVRPFFDGFDGSLSENSLPSSQHYHHAQVLQTQNYVGAQPAATAAASPTTAPPRQRVRVRARRGQATDPHSIAERLRRERIADRMKALQKLVPNSNKTDKASMLDEIIEYVKFLQLQAKVLSISRLGGAAPLVSADKSLEGRSGVTTASNDGEGLAAVEQQVAKLMDEDIGAAMQYLQGKGLCLVPISIANDVSRRNPPFNKKADDDAGPSSPTASALTVQSGKEVAEN